MNLSKKRIILSKTNRIGDVIMSLPVAAALKESCPDCYVIMLVTQYTAEIAKQFISVDEVIVWDTKAVQENPIAALKALRADIIIHLRGNKKIAQTAKRAKIPLRIGAVSRIYHWFYCNQFIRVSRNRYSPWHDAQLDMLFVLSLISKPMPTTKEIAKLMQFHESKTPCFSLSFLKKNRFNLIIHPKSVTDAGKREWPLSCYAQVIAALDPKQFRIFITGTENEGEQVRELLCKPFQQVVDLTGKLSLAELQCVIQQADGLIAGSTGPLHMAAALGIHALGLMTPTLGHQPSRWAPLGKKAEYLVSNNIHCRNCTKKIACCCIKDITPKQVIDRITHWQEKSL